MNKVRTPIHLKDARLFLDECMRTREPVSIIALTKEGKKNIYTGWIVQSSYFLAGTHDIRNPKNGQIRKIKDILIFNINGHPIYL